MNIRKRYAAAGGLNHSRTAALGVLESRQVQPVGATRPSAIDIRFVAATNQDLQARVAYGAFRADLYFRLAQ
jgi:sigma-54 dependent transcriptional regulator, acetoin dehydrogenase operon transcriptional activator AcoR